MRSSRVRGIGLVVVLACTAAMYAGCGGDGGDDEGSTSGPPSGDLSFFGFEDAFDPELVDPFVKQFPEVNLETGDDEMADARMLAH